jgi:hypothetical protein
MKRQMRLVATIVAVLTAGVASADGPVKLDPALVPYKAVSGVSGNISSVG